MTCSLTLCKFQVLRKLTRFTLSLRKISSQTNAKIEKPTRKEKKIRYPGNWISPKLTALRTQELETITGLIIGWTCVSWFRMSLLDLTVLDWDVKNLPKNFGKVMMEPEILDFAHDVKAILPESDVYIMESTTIRDITRNHGFNKIQLSSMLAVLLNNFGINKKDKIIYQKRFVMDYMYDTVISSERISTRSVAANILLKHGYLGGENTAVKSSVSQPRIELDHKFVENFKETDVITQETLSIALLFTLSFIDVNIFRNEKSIEKIQMRKTYRKEKRK